MNHSRNALALALSVALASAVLWPTAAQTPTAAVRGFYSRIDGSAQLYVLTLPDHYDRTANRQYRLDLFMHGRDDTTLEQQFMTKSTTGYTSKPLGPGDDRFMLQPYGRYTNGS